MGFVPVAAGLGVAMARAAWSSLGIPPARRAACARGGRVGRDRTACHVIALTTLRPVR
jgi:hypothetical protein